MQANRLINQFMDTVGSKTFGEIPIRLDLPAVIIMKYLVTDHTA